MHHWVAQTESSPHQSRLSHLSHRNRSVGCTTTQGDWQIINDRLAKTDRPFKEIQSGSVSGLAPNKQGIHGRTYPCPPHSKL